MSKEEFQKIQSQLLEMSKNYKAMTSKINLEIEKSKVKDELIEELIKSKGETIITLNVGGQQYQTYLKNLLQAKYSFFYYFYLDRLENKREITQVLFFDRNSTYFHIIMNFLRNKIIILDCYSEEELLDIKREILYFGIWQAYDKFLELETNIRIVNMISSGPYFANGVTYSKFDTLHLLGNKKPVYTNASPYFITLELNKEIEFKNICIGGSNDILINSSYGANSVISVSKDNVLFTDVGKLPPNYDFNPRIILLNGAIGKYIRFKHTDYVGIGFLRFNVEENSLLDK